MNGFEIPVAAYRCRVCASETDVIVVSGGRRLVSVFCEGCGETRTHVFDGEGGGR